MLWLHLGGRISPDRFDSCSVNDSLQRQLCVMSACEVWLSVLVSWHRQRRVRVAMGLGYDNLAVGAGQAARRHRVLRTGDTCVFVW
jgi:hypothetical protein